MSISRKCVPFTPFDRELAKSTIAIVTAGGVHMRDQEGFNISDELGDLTYRIIPQDVSSNDLMVTHHHYDHEDADQDINVVFPVDVLRELKEEISYAPASVSLFCCDTEADVVRHVFYAQLSADVKDLVLLEGWDMKLLAPSDIRTGKCYSEQSRDVRPFGIAHQRILLNFIDSIG
ncbi:MAG: hypothetical protein ICV86_17195 [Microcoleus sp. T3-bin5]|nr:hypothetical protein [Microcoleus sp. T3-bin5]